MKCHGPRPRVQHREPRLALGIEPLRGDGAQGSRGGLLAIFPVHVEQRRDVRLLDIRARLERAPAPDPSQHLSQGGAPSGRAARSHARHALEPAVVGRGLEPLERVHVQLVVDAPRKLQTQSRHGLEDLLGIGGAPQPLELRPAPGHEHLRDRRGDAQAHAGNAVEPSHPFGIEDGAHAAGVVREGIGGIAVSAHPIGAGTLVVEQSRGLPQPLGDLQVLLRNGDGRPRRPRGAGYRLAGAQRAHDAFFSGTAAARRRRSSFTSSSSTWVKVR